MQPPDGGFVSYARDMLFAGGIEKGDAGILLFVPVIVTDKYEPVLLRRVTNQPEKDGSVAGKTKLQKPLFVI